jgi:hypothetical protein
MFNMFFKKLLCKFNNGKFRHCAQQRPHAALRPHWRSVRCSALRGGFWKMFSPRFGKLASLMLSQLRAAATLCEIALGQLAHRALAEKRNSFAEYKIIR